MRIIYKLKIFLHKIKNYYLRKKNGAGCCDIYSLYYYLGKKILKPLKLFRKNLNGFPVAYIGKRQMTMKDWENIIDKMIYAFESIELDEKGKKVNYKKQQEGFKLFGKWFTHLFL